ncbi:MAG: hypothetical protein ACFE0Q_00280 [Anaerolineae bacterium]
MTWFGMESVVAGLTITIGTIAPALAKLQLHLLFPVERAFRRCVSDAVY